MAQVGVAGGSLSADFDDAVLIEINPPPPVQRLVASQRHTCSYAIRLCQWRAEPDHGHAALSSPDQVSGTILFDWAHDGDRALLLNATAAEKAPCLRLAEAATPFNDVAYYPVRRSALSLADHAYSRASA